MSSTIRGRETRGTLPDLLVGGILFLVTALALLLCVHDVLSISAAPPGPVVPLVPVLAEATLDDLVFGLESGHFTSVDLVKAYIARIDEVNPALKPVLSLNPDALALATESDAQRRRRPKGRADLHGIPVLLKDNIATADRMDTTAGSYALAGAEVGEDSTVAARLRRAGAILLGKTNLSQWSNFRGSNSSHGWSAVGGQTLGAYHPRQDPGGSSSGSGVACTLGLAAVCLGTETDGSIVAPAEKSNLAGIKPTVGLTSRHLVVPVSEHMDTVGPMARTVKDAARVLAVIAGPDPKDNYTFGIPFRHTPDYVGACDEAALSNKRIGIPRNVFNLGALDKRQQVQYEPVIAAFNASLHVLREAGAELVDNVFLQGHELLSSAPLEKNALVGGFASALASYLAKLTVNPHGITSLDELRSFTQRTPAEDWPHYGTEFWDEILDSNSGANDSPAGSELFWSNYNAAVFAAGHLGITGALSNKSLDALVLPTGFSPHLPAILGSPLVTVPLGAYPSDFPLIPTTRGNLNSAAPNVPFGISFLGERFSEERLVGMAYAFEQRTHARRKAVPYITPHTELSDVVYGNR